METWNTVLIARITILLQKEKKQLTHSITLGLRISRV